MGVMEVMASSTRFLEVTAVGCYRSETTCGRAKTSSERSVSGVWVEEWGQRRPQGVLDRTGMGSMLNEAFLMAHGLNDGNWKTKPIMTSLTAACYVSGGTSATFTD